MILSLRGKSCQQHHTLRNEEGKKENPTWDISSAASWEESAGPVWTRGAAAERSALRAGDRERERERRKFPCSGASVDLLLSHVAVDEPQGPTQTNRLPFQQCGSARALCVTRAFWRWPPRVPFEGCSIPKISDPFKLKEDPDTERSTAGATTSLLLFHNVRMQNGQACA